MPQAYTPGLAVSDGVLVRKERRLPVRGEVLVRVGDRVSPDTVVARTELPGKVTLVNVAGTLSIPPSELESHMKVRVGDFVPHNEVLAETKGLLGLFKSQCRAPVSGTVESLSTVTGQVVLREQPLPIEVRAYIQGEVVEVFPGEGVTVQTWATFVQGIFGVGGETVGELAFATDSPTEPLTPDQLRPEDAGKVVVGGSRIEREAMNRARQLGIRALIAGGMDDADLNALLGYELGVAITGHEEIGITLIITEGFGEIAMAERTFALLRKHKGALASVNGATQIRAGVLRPEIVIPHEGPHEGQAEKVPGVLEVGSPVRVIRNPYFGRVGVVTALPVELKPLETEAHVRVATVRLGDEEVILPRANIELIET